MVGLKNRVIVKLHVFYVVSLVQRVI
uniref:Uncharacterized protein n=1 Tax=Anguilla anguilla TaxID=7936 RepID=A0A0E9R208_ANGAN